MNLVDASINLLGIIFQIFGPKNEILCVPQKALLIFDKLNCENEIIVARLIHDSLDREHLCCKDLQILNVYRDRLISF